jgi:hypothetical protein
MSAKRPSADSGKLFSRHHVEHPIAPDPAAEGDDSNAAVIVRSGPRGTCGDSLRPQDRQRTIRIPGRDEDCESAFVRDVEWIKAEQFAGSTNDIRNRDERFLDRNPKSGDRSDLIGHGGSSNPYLGVLFDLLLTGAFVAGLVLILAGILIRRSYLLSTDQVPSFFPEVSVHDPVFRHGLDIVVVATLPHVGGDDALRHLSGFHGAHSGKIEYVSSDANDQVIPWVRKTNPDGSTTDFVASGASVPDVAHPRVMDCIACHNRAAHSFDTAEGALDKMMAQGSPNASLPFLHKEGLVLLNAKYDSQGEAKARITSGLITFYRSQYLAVWDTQRTQVETSANILLKIYLSNVFLAMTYAGGRIPTTSAIQIPQDASLATMEVTPARPERRSQMTVLSATTWWCRMNCIPNS